MHPTLDTVHSRSIQNCNHAEKVDNESTVTLHIHHAPLHAYPFHRFTKSSFLMMTHPALNLFSSSLPVSWMIFQQQMVAASTQNSLQHAPNEVSSPQKFFSTHHDEQYMHEPKSKTLSGPASSFLADESNENKLI